jgi:proteasome lid subunit RPN8/RPN11
MVLLQCFTSWFRFTNRDITFGRCLVPFYYWIASTEEKPKDKFSSYDLNEDELDEEDD